MALVANTLLSVFPFGLKRGKAPKSSRFRKLPQLIAGGSPARTVTSSSVNTVRCRNARERQQLLTAM